MIDDLEQDEKPSKSERKRESAAIMKFAQKLSQLSPKQIAQLGLPDDIREELQLAISIKSYAARNRQVKSVGGSIRRSGTYAELQQKYQQILWPRS